MNNENGTSDYVNTVHASRSATVTELLEQLDKGGDFPEGHEYEGADAYTVLAEFPLSIERKELIEITLGVGGPSDWMEATCTRNRYGLEVESVTYYATWGSDKFTRELSNWEPLYMLAEFYVEGLGD